MTQLRNNVKTSLRRMSLRDGATQRVQLVEQQLVVLDGHDNGGGRARVVGQDDIATAGFHLSNEVLVELPGRDEITGNALRAAECLNCGVLHGTSLS